MRGKAVAAGAVATLAMVAGVTYWAVSGDDEPFAVSGYKAMCQKPREYTEAAPHAGFRPPPGLHRRLLAPDGHRRERTERFLRSCDYDSLLGSSSEDPFTLHLYTHQVVTDDGACHLPPPPPPQRSRWPPAGNRE